MSGRNIFLILIAVIAAVAAYMLVMDPDEPPVAPAVMPSLVAPRDAPPPPPTVDQRVEPVPALDDVANDAAAEVERLKKEQEEMDQKPPETMPDGSEPMMR